MKSTIPFIIKLSGISAAVIGIAMLLPLLVSLIHGETDASKAFGTSIPICILGGLATYFIFQNYRPKFYTKESIIMLSCIWISASIAGALPLFLSGYYPTFFDAVFESCSGFTTTGATTIQDVEALPVSIILWRSMTQWFGGFAIILFAIRVVPGLFVDGTSITSADKLTASFPSNLRRLLKVGVPVLGFYLAVTLITIVLLFLSGMSQFDAIIYTLGTISTGGFTNYNDGMMHLNSKFAILVILFVMSLTGLSINVVYSSIRRGKFLLHKNIEYRLYTIILLCSSFFLALKLFLSDNTIIHSIFSGVFMAVSIITTTGCAVTDYTQWPAFCITILMLLLLFGSCSVSVGSGNKIIRLAVVIDLVRHGIESRLHPRAVSKIKIGDKDLPTDTASSVANYMFLYMFFVFAGALIMAFEGVSISSCLANSLSLVSNTGISFDAPGHINTIGDYHWYTKILLCIIMIAGRLELYNVIVLFMPSFWRTK